MDGTLIDLDARNGFEFWICCPHRITKALIIHEGKKKEDRRKQKRKRRNDKLIIQSRKKKKKLIKREQNK